MGEIGSGQTQNTTAQITSQHGMFFQKFLEKKGEETTLKYVQANQIAIEEYKRIIRKENIDCDFAESDSFVYSGDEEKLLREMNAAQRFGIEAYIQKELEISVPYAGAVCLNGQAQFHPLKFIGRLAEELVIYENSMVIEVEEQWVRTAKGSVSADKIIFATHYPFVNFPGMHFIRAYQERSYVLALKNAGRISEMYKGDVEDTLSLCSYKNYILLGGQGHRTGENIIGGCYERLKEEAKKLYPKSRIVAPWSAQECITTDDIHLIGRYANSRPNWYVATGFHKWRMSSSMVSAMMLRDMICG